MKTKPIFYLAVLALLLCVVCLVKAQRPGTGKVLPKPPKPVVCLWNAYMSEAAIAGLLLQDANPKITQPDFSREMLALLNQFKIQHSRYCKAVNHEVVQMLDVSECEPSETNVIPPERVMECNVILAQRKDYLTPRSLYWTLLRRRRDGN